MDTEAYDYAGIDETMEGVGFKISINHPLDTPVMQQSGISIAPGSSNRLGVGVNLIDVDPAVLRWYPNPADRECYTSSDINLQFLSYDNDRQYSISNCYFEAALQTALERCECSPGFYAVSDQPCQGPGLKCFYDIMNRIGIFIIYNDVNTQNPHLR